MGRVIAVANQKGGVGKTTTCVNFTAALRRMGKKVLLLDFDPQGNATSGMGVSKRSRPNAYDVLIGGEEAKNAVIPLPYGDLLPSNSDLSGAEVQLVDMERREYRLREAIEPLRQRYDYIFIDCPPSLGLLPLNAFTAADALLVPLQCEYFAMEGVADLSTTVKLCRRRLNPGLEISAILLTMYDARVNFSAQVAAELRGYFGERVLETVNPPKCASGRGAQPRPAHYRIRQTLQGRSGLHGRRRGISAKRGGTLWPLKENTGWAWA